MIKFEYGKCSRKVLKEGTNVESFGCIFVNSEEVSVLPFHPGFLNGNIIGEETSIQNRDLLNFNNIHIIIHRAKVAKIDLTTDLEDTIETIDLTEEIEGDLPGDSNNKHKASSSDMDIENSKSSDQLREPRTPNYGYYSEESMDLDYE